MNFLFALVLLPLVNCQVSTLKLQSSQQSLFGCTVTLFKTVAYQKDGIMAKGYGWMVKNFEECIEKCLMNEQCKAVNLVNGNICQPLRSGIQSADRLPPRTDFFSSFNTDHASVSCPEPKASGPVGCGKQAAGYLPTLTKVVRIIGGNEAKPHSWPWQVYLKSATGPDTFNFCGASLIRVKADKEESDILVTAAHCITYGDIFTTPQVYPAANVSGVLGNHNNDRYEAGQRSIVASKVLMHADFKMPRNDIALVKLSAPVKFTDTIRPICLPTQGEAIPVGRRCAVSGWGRISSTNQDKSPALKQLAVAVHSAADCRAGWGGSYVESDMICAGSMKGDEGICRGDSGGMLACEQADNSWTLYGASSFVNGDACLSPKVPGVFARVSSYVDWIRKNIATLSTV